MLTPNTRRVFVAKDGVSANMIAGILTAAGFPADAMDVAVAGGADITGYSHGVEVWVINPDHAEPAKQFLEEEIKSAEAEKQKRANRTGTLTVICEDCGKPSEWPATAMGTTEVCPHCGGYMDVPDPDEDWSDVDFGEAEEENEAGK